MKENNKKQKVKNFDRELWMYGYAIINSMFLWLFPIGLIICFVNGFTKINIVFAIAGLYIFLCTIYTAWKNKFFHNLLQLLLNIFLSIYLLQISSRATDYTFASSVILITGIILLCTSFFVLINFCFRKHIDYK